jgi:hypothetical protein
MLLSPRLLRRAGAGAAAVYAAVLIPAVALAAPGRAARPAAAPGCTQAQLRDWIGVPPGVAAGTAFYQLEISNISARACTLLGFPGVFAVGGSGTQLGSPAERNISDPVRRVTLGRGATAHVELGDGTGADFPGCHPVAAAGLRVFAPGDFRSETIPFPGFGACRTPGPRLISVSPVLAGTGIPRFSH